MIDFESAPSSGDYSDGDFPGRSAPLASALAPAEFPRYLEGLNERQREAVLAVDGPLIVLAGAGSGKTKMLTSRIAYLIGSCGVAPYHVLAVTFTNKAAGEMRERVERTLDAAARESGAGHFLGAPEIGTFHSVCVRLLRREIRSTPFTKPFVIYDDSDQLSLVKAAMSKLGIDEKSFNPKAIQGAINRLKCDAVEPQEVEPSQHDIFQRQVRRVYEQYQKDLFANNALDFGEIICMTYRILRDFPEVRQKYQRRFRYIHVDEYQDTNRAQYFLLTMLANRNHGGHQNICVVGDEDQSIYKWRGADINNILDFEKDYPGARVVKLEQNYRSTQTIIRAASQVISNNRTRKDKTLWTDNEEGVPIVRAQLPDERAEAEMVVSELKRLAEHEGRGYGEFAIFYRTNAQSRQFEDVLRREKIPYQIVGGLRFYDRKEIKDVLSYLRAVLNPSDSVAVKRIINVPARGIGKTTIDKLDSFHSERAEEMDYWMALEHLASHPEVTSPATARKLGQFVTLMRRLTAEQPKLLLSELYHLILDETGYVRGLRQEGTEEAMDRIENLEEFDRLVKEFEDDLLERVPENERDARKHELLPLFIEQSSLASDADKLDSLGSSIKLMTLHSSKGLEFPVVFMVGMEEGLFPSIKPWEETPDEDIEEERRLCYVGMTRARQALYLMNVLVRRFWGNVSHQEPSRFFQEIPAELLELRDFTYKYQRSGGPVGSGDRSRQAETATGPRLAFSSQWQEATRRDGMIGRKLHHPEYGDGTIIEASGSGEDEKVTVEFRNRERRKFLLRYLTDYLQR